MNKLIIGFLFGTSSGEGIDLSHVDMSKVLIFTVICLLAIAIPTAVWVWRVSR